MIIKSENIRKYMMYNLNIENEDIDMKDMLKLKKININGLNSKLEQAYFVPEELGYLKEIEECSFSKLEITNEIIINLNKLKKLKIIQYDFCNNISDIKIENAIKKIYINYSDFSLLTACNNTEAMEIIFLKNVNNVDINKICKFKNVKKIYLLNCNVIGISLLEQLESLEYLEVIGSNIDNKETIGELSKRIKVRYSEEEYFNVG